MKFYLPSTVLFCTVLNFLFVAHAHAYDEDTHFYGTRAMARFAGIRAEVATKIALSAQWMDESYISDPTSMLLMPITGVKKRRLLHFPSTRIAGSLNTESQQEVLGFDHLGETKLKLIQKIVEFSGFDGKLDTINFFTETEEDHPFASELLMQGLKQGNLMMASASLHVIEDSFAHAGTPAEQGHAAFWHWPDRPYASGDKYFRMTRAVFRALVAIRAQLPKEALDCSIKTADIPNCGLSAAELADSYAAIPAVRDTVTYNVLTDPEYVEAALRDFYERAVKVGYITLDERNFTALTAGLGINGSINTYEALEKLIAAIYAEQNSSNQEIMHIKYILENMGRISTDDSMSVQDYVDTYGVDGSSSLMDMNSRAFGNFVHVMARELLRWNVPLPLSDSHRMEIEDDKGIVRETEMRIRTRKMRQLLTQLFGDDVLLVENNSKDEVGFTKEVDFDPAAEPVIPSDAGKAEIATFSLAEKNRWDTMIFQYLFPTLDVANLHVMASIMADANAIDEYLKKRDAINGSDQSWFDKKAALLALDQENFHVLHDLLGSVDSLLLQVRPLAKTVITDLLTTHIVPSSDNFVYRNARLFDSYRNDRDANGKTRIQKFLGASDVWTLSSLNLNGALPAPSLR